jgi:hypothetical protein
MMPDCGLRLSSHAKQRLQQRGVRKRDVGIVMEHGTDTEEAILLTNHDVAEAIAEYRRRIADLERLRGVALVIADDTVVSVYRPDSDRKRRFLDRRIGGPS